ncbi:MAG: YihY family inner membrane protein [Pseudomonadales bacterium]|nr:YihY family inner membrane protein [Pseudomonadales bacterium]
MLGKLWVLARWLGKELVRQFVIGDCMSRAAALTYTTLFAVVPFMTVTYLILSTFSDFSEIGETIKHFIFSNFVPESSLAVQEQLTRFSEQARGLTSFSVGFLFVTSFLMIITIEKAFNGIWQVTEQRRGLQRFLLYWGVLTFGPPMLVGSLLVSSYLLYLPFVSGLDTYGVRESLLAYIPVASEIAVFTFLFYAIPNCRVAFKHALSGGVITMLLFEVAKYAFTKIVVGSSLETIYGAFAAVPLFLVWLYLVWVLILSGAVIVRTLSLSPQAAAGSKIPALVQCLSVLQVLYRAHMEGITVDERQLMDESFLDGQSKDSIMVFLHQQNLVGASDDQGFMLTRSLKRIRLWDLYLLLPEGLSAATLASMDNSLPGMELLREYAQTGAVLLDESLESLIEKSADAKD